MMQIASWATIALEYSLIGPLVPRIRNWVIIPGMLFHAAIYVSLPVATFTLQMWLLYLAFFDADRVHRFIDELSGHDAGESVS